MALGAMTLVEKVEGQGPVIIARVNQVGDGAYSAGGSTGVLAKLQALLGRAVDIISVKDEGILADIAEYDHANEKLFIRVKATGVESAVANQSGVTYALVITCK